MRVRKCDIGRWASVKYDDVGNRDCLIVGVEPFSERFGGTCEVFFPYEGTDHVDFSQVTSLRKHQAAG